MIDKSEYRALVVDDELVIRQLTARALSQEGFVCDKASDGAEGARLANQIPYDVVVTDLRMPKRHGHSLAVELLAAPKRPLIVVLTGVIEPRVAKDLMKRGVDDIVYKPVDYPSFAAKVSMLVQRRSRQAAVADDAGAKNNSQAAAPTHEKAVTLGDHDKTPISMEEIESKVSLISDIVPISEVALEVFEMTRTGQHGAEQLAASIGRDPLLVAEVLSIANSSFYNATAESITQLETAVARIGQKRLGELALATNALSAMTANSLSWMDAQATWRASIGAGAAIEHLVTQGRHSSMADGLFLAAIMHGLGRVILGTLFPHRYQQLVQVCQRDSLPLIDLERTILPENHARIMVRLMSAWNIPKAIVSPLDHFLDSYDVLTTLSKDARTKVELLKVSVLVGKIATQSWQPWELVELPATAVLQRLGIYDIQKVLDQTREDVAGIISRHPGQDKKLVGKKGEGKDAPQVLYCDAAEQPFDFIEALVAGMGTELTAQTLEQHDPKQKLLVNAFGAPDSLSARLKSDERSNLYLVTTRNDAKRFGEFGNPLSLPASYASLCAFCRSTAVK